MNGKQQRTAQWCGYSVVFLLNVARLTDGKVLFLLSLGNLIANGTIKTKLIPKLKDWRQILLFVARHCDRVEQPGYSLSETNNPEQFRKDVELALYRSSLIHRAEELMNNVPEQDVLAFLHRVYDLYSDSLALLLSKLTSVPSLHEYLTIHRLISYADAVLLLRRFSAIVPNMESTTFIRFVYLLWFKLGKPNGDKINQAPELKANLMGLFKLERYTYSYSELSKILVNFDANFKPFIDIISTNEHGQNNHY